MDAAKARVRVGVGTRIGTRVVCISQYQGWLEGMIHWLGGMIHWLDRIKKGSRANVGCQIRGLLIRALHQMLYDTVRLSNTRAKVGGIDGGIDTYEG